jgi:glycosyltransferase involved in cell wall biosynthesis
MPLTVVHISDSELFGGTEQIILELLETFGGRGWNCVLLRPQVQALSPLAERARSLGVEQYASQTLNGWSGLARLPHLIRQLRSIRPAVVHAHLTTPLGCRFSLIAAAVARVPAVVATAHLLIESSANRSAQQRVLVSAVDRYIAVSKHVASRLRDGFGVPSEKISTVLNGVRLARFDHLTPNGLRDQLTGGANVPVILTVARLHPQKGLEFLLDAARQVPDALFLVAGEGPQRPALEQEARALGLGARVRFLGFRTDVPELLANCDLFVLPSLFEGLPISVLEAMAAGKPVVATSVGGTDEAVVDGDTGLLVPPGDAPALATAIRQLIHDGALAERLGAAGRARVAAHFTAQTMVEQVATVYEEALA